MNTRRLALLTIVLVLAGLAGCTRAPAPAAGPPAPGPGYAAVARGQIAVPGGLLAIVAPVDGSVRRIDVAEGDHVHKGQVLAQLDDTQARDNLDMAAAQFQQAQAQEKLLALQEQSARQRAQRETAAAHAGAGAGQAADEANAQVAQLGARRAAAQAAIAVAHARLAHARYVLDQHRLLAPFDAFVVHVRTQQGANVTPASGALFLLLPDRPPIVRAELNASYVNAIHPGMPANVVFEDGPEGTGYAAHVVRVGRILETSTLDEDPTTRATERTVECVLDFDKPNALRIGRRVLVRFLSGRGGKTPPAASRHHGPAPGT